MRYFTLATAALLLTLTACGSNDQENDTHMDDNMQMEENRQMEENMHDEAGDMKSEQNWVREEPIDVEAIDEDGDGYVYQDHMDWNVIADEEGRCPVCGMDMERTPVENAKEHLRENGFEVK